jgi:hypothetical protein
VSPYRASFFARGRARVRARALIRLALWVSTWQRLVPQGLADREAARLMVDAAAPDG